MNQTTKAVEATDKPELDQVLASLGFQNNQFVTTLEKFEELGHRLKNTKIEMKAEKGDIPMTDGILNEIKLQLNYFQIHNDELNALLAKFQSIV